MSRAIIEYDGKRWEMVGFRYPIAREWVLEADGTVVQVSYSVPLALHILRPLEQEAPQADNGAPNCFVCGSALKWDKNAWTCEECGPAQPAPASAPERPIAQEEKAEAPVETHSEAPLSDADLLLWDKFAVAATTPIYLEDDVPKRDLKLRAESVAQYADAMLAERQKRGM